MTAALSAEDPDEFLDLFRSAYQHEIDYTSTWRKAERYAGTAEDLAPYLGVTDELIPFYDEALGEQLWVLTKGTTRYEAQSETLVKEQWSTWLDSQREAARLVRIFGPSRYVVIRSGDEPPQLIEGTGATPDEVRVSRRKGELAAGEMSGAADFLGLVRRGLRLLPHAKDLSVEREEEGTVTLASEEFGISCTIDAATGECLAASFAKPGKQPTTWRVIDSFPRPMFPARHPSLLRREWTAFGEFQAELVIFDEVEVVKVPSSQIHWSYYRDTAWDRIANTIIDSDGTVLQEDVGSSKSVALHVPPDYARPRPITRAADPGEVPGSSDSRRATPRAAPPMPMSPVRLGLFIGGGGLLAAWVGLVFWRRFRA